MGSIRRFCLSALYIRRTSRLSTDTHLSFDVAWNTKSHDPPKQFSESRNVDDHLRRNRRNADDHFAYVYVRGYDIRCAPGTPTNAKSPQTRHDPHLHPSTCWSYPCHFAQASGPCPAGPPLRRSHGTARYQLRADDRPTRGQQWSLSPWVGVPGGWDRRVGYVGHTGGEKLRRRAKGSTGGRRSMRAPGLARSQSRRPASGLYRVHEMRSDDARMDVRR